MKLFLLIIASFLPSFCTAADWCNLENCKGAVHVDCDMANGDFGDACPDDAVMLNLAPAQESILDKMNTYRNRVAGGLLTGKFAATRMATLAWNVSLANLGRKSVKKCTNTQDACVNTPDYDFVGQSIAQAVFPKTDKRTNLEVILSLIDLWFGENKDAKMADLRVFPLPADDKPVIANFAQLVRDYANRVGCGALTYPDGANKIISLTCNYNLANVVGWPTYDDGPVASKCQTGKNTKFPNLCSASEQYNVNTFYDDNHYGV